MSEKYLDEAQRLVEHLAMRIGQSVAVDDLDGSLITVSRHYGDADEYRLLLILERRTPSIYKAYFQNFIGVDAVEPLHVPGKKDLGLEPRIRYPIRDKSGAFAFMWIIDKGVPLPEDVIIGYCERLAEVLAKRVPRPSDADKNSGLASRIRLLISDCPAQKSSIDIAVGDSHYDQNLVVATTHLPDAPNVTRQKARRVLQELPTFVPDLGVKLAAFLSVRECMVAVFSLPSDIETFPEIENRLVQAANRVMDRKDFAFCSGLSGEGKLSDIPKLFADAALASFLGTRLYPANGILPYREVAALAQMLRTPTFLGGATGLGTLQEMFSSPNSFAFDTIGAMLLSGPMLGAVADRMQIHRTTLHYRIQQIEQRTSVDLRDPAQRFLATCLWLQIAIRSSSLSTLLK